MFLVGLTGGIGTGKSTVAQMFVELGIPIIDADVLARKVVEPGRTAWEKIRQEFGEDVFDSSGYLNRQALGEIIFNDATLRKKLNEITHPEIRKEMMWGVIRHFFQGYQFVVLDLPLLFETGVMLDYLHKTIVVTCEEDLQVQRVMERNNLTESKVKQRIQAQMPLDRKCQMANFVIENSGSLDDTKNQLLRIVSLLKSAKIHWRIRIILGLCFGGVFSLIMFLTYKFVCYLR